MFDGSLRPNAAPDSNSTGPSWRGLKTAKKRRWETLLMNGSCERLQSGKGDVHAHRSVQASGIESRNEAARRFDIRQSQNAMSHAVCRRRAARARATETSCDTPRSAIV